MPHRNYIQISEHISARCLIKHAIVAEACGTGNMQNGLHLMDRTPQQPLGLMAGEDVHTDYRAFNISYKDTGVFGKRDDKYDVLLSLMLRLDSLFASYASGS